MAGFEPPGDKSIMRLLPKIFRILCGIDTWGLSISKPIRLQNCDSDDRNLRERIIVEAMCGGPRFVPWYDVNWGILRNEMALSLLAKSITAAAPALGTEILSKVTHRYEGRPVNEYTARNKMTGIAYKVFFDGSCNCPRCQGSGV